MSEIEKKDNSTGLEIAVIGMAGRFPGARNIKEFWKNLKNGMESITFLGDDELKKLGVNAQLLECPDYVKTRGGILDDEGKEYFDAVFFGYNPSEAEIMTPQVRVFLECAWEALEHAGYAPTQRDCLVGLYAGASDDFYWKVLTRLCPQREVLGEFAVSLITDKDFLPTHISYKLNLRGPSVLVKTACSTSLVAIHMACQGILNSECDMAMAGGITIRPTKDAGYLYQEGMIGAPDGHCRAFDAEAKGVAAGEGVGIVVLKFLQDAINDGDYIHAVIKSSAINNDGNRKAGFTAPSVVGQAETINVALKLAEVEPESIGYIEAHGTGTTVGDPIEIEALTLAFHTNKKRYCRIGSVKTNIGHLDAAAGVAGFIKTVLALSYRLIPPSLHFNTPNPRIDFENSPFIVNNRLTEWKNDQYPLRAGVSSFGIGGTNVHIILEEAPGRTATQSARQYQAFILSAKTETALNTITENLANHFKKNSDINLADAAYTLHVGRKAFPHRKMLVCSQVSEAAAALSSQNSRKVHTGFVKEAKRIIVFVLSGLGSQYVNMGLGLYQTEPVFREEIDRCFKILKPLMGYDIKEILYPGDSLSKGSGGSPGKIDKLEIAQVVVFILEYALAKLLMQWGIKPHVMIGYSFGEYAAACLSGVFSLEDALKTVVLRGQLIDQMPPGAMLSLPLPREDVQTLLKDTPQGAALSLAIDNGPSCIVSGSVHDIEAFEKRMKEKKYVCVRLSGSHALHSHMMTPVMKNFRNHLCGLSLNKPQVPYISNVTGTWITPGQAVDPEYWAVHLRNTVRFADGIKELLKKPNSIFVEVGPSHDLSVLFRHHLNKSDPSHPTIVNLVRHAQSDIPDDRYLLRKIGRLWLSGIDIHWSELYSEEKRYRIPLPTYPFEGQRYWIDDDLFNAAVKALYEKSAQGKRPDIKDWLYIPSWKRSIPIRPGNTKRKIPKKYCWLVFMDAHGLGSQLVNRLKTEDQDVLIIKPSLALTRVKKHEYTIDPQKNDDYNALFKELGKVNKIPDRIVHLWGITKSEGGKQGQGRQAEDLLEEVEQSQNLGFYSLLYFAQAVGKQRLDNPMQLHVVSNHLHQFTGEEEVCPGKTTVLGAVKVIPREYTNISCRSIDVALPVSGGQPVENLVHQLIEEFSIESADDVVAYRGDYRWAQVFEPVPQQKSREEKSLLKKGGVYLVTGGLGGIGYVLAKHLVSKAAAKLILTGRSDFPPKDQWKQWLTTSPRKDPVCLKIKKVQDLEKMGAEVLVCSADVADLNRMQEVILQAEKQFGPINGVIHAAGVTDGCVIPKRTREETDRILAPKINGTLVLDHVLKQVKLDFFVLCSSLSTILGPFGQIGYCAANTFQDAFAYQKSSPNGTHVVSINWDVWQEVGMGVETVRQLKENENITDVDALLEHGILPSEGILVFDRMLDYTFPQIAVSTRDLIAGLDQMLNTGMVSGPTEEVAIEEFSGALYQRPELCTDYVPPKTEFEKKFVDILQKFFGFEQVGIHDNLFDFGLTSLSMIQINNLLKKKMNKDIPIVVMFEYPTIYSLEQYLNPQKKNKCLADKPTGQTGDLEKVEGLMHKSINLLRE